MTPVILTTVPATPFHIRAEDAPKSRSLSIPDLAQYFLENMGTSLSEAARAFSVTPSTVSRIISADSYQEYAQSLARQNNLIYIDPTQGVKSKALVAVNDAVDLLHKRLDSDVNNTDLVKITETLAGIAGCKDRSGASVNVQINNLPSPSGAMLRNARATFTQPLEA